MVGESWRRALRGMLKILRGFTKDLFFVRIRHPERETYEKVTQRETNINIDEILGGAVGHCTHNCKKRRLLQEGEAGV